MGSVPQERAGDQDEAAARWGDLVRFREEFYSCLGARADALFELAEALLCADGPVRSLVELSLAPEQRAGDPLDGRADLYALGCVAYWLLTGELVFPAATPVAMLVQHAREKPAAPSSRTELAVPAALDHVVLQCLEKSPRDRPASARELARKLADVARECEPWTPERAEQWWRAHLPRVVAVS